MTRVFVSYRSSDRDIARGVERLLASVGVASYLDIRDNELADAVSAQSAEGVVHAIESGIGKCTHMLCVVSNRTKGSWWVPFEIGAGRNLGIQGIASLVVEDVKFLPEFLRVANPLLDMYDLKKWVNGIAHGIKLSESIDRHYQVPRITSYRTLGDITWTKGD